MALAPYVDLLPRLTVLLTDKLTADLDADERSELAEALGRFLKMQVSTSLILHCLHPNRLFIGVLSVP